ncbi:hypothetical protein K474DRAFT_719804 [Panus rudis PR-1116 ss-1]|nr:hypothetical protein K474DRAFT_719804 [Panus rudis PR-1116 ss-1]
MTLINSESISDCSTPSLSRTTTASGYSSSSTCGIYTPADMSRVNSVVDVELDSDDNARALDEASTDHTRVSLPDDSDETSRLRNSVANAMRRARAIAKNTLNVSKTLRKFWK